MYTLPGVDDDLVSSRLIHQTPAFVTDVTVKS